MNKRSRLNKLFVYFLAALFVGISTPALSKTINFNEKYYTQYEENRIGKDITQREKKYQFQKFIKIDSEQVKFILLDEVKLLDGIRSVYIAEEYEMYVNVWLVNYSLKDFQYIDSVIIFADEWAESAFMTTSKIMPQSSKIIITDGNYMSTPPETEKITVTITPAGHFVGK